MHGEWHYFLNLGTFSAHSRILPRWSPARIMPVAGKHTFDANGIECQVRSANRPLTTTNRHRYSHHPRHHPTGPPVLNLDSDQAKVFMNRIKRMNGSNIESSHDAGCSVAAGGGADVGGGGGGGGGGASTRPSMTSWLRAGAGSAAATAASAASAAASTAAVAASVAATTAAEAAAKRRSGAAAGESAPPAAATADEDDQLPNVPSTAPAPAPTWRCEACTLENDWTLLDAEDGSGTQEYHALSCRACGTVPHPPPTPPPVQTPIVTVTAAPLDVGGVTFASPPRPPAGGSSATSSADDTTSGGGGGGGSGSSSRSGSSEDVGSTAAKGNKGKGRPHAVEVCCVCGAQLSGSWLKKTIKCARCGGACCSAHSKQKRRLRPSQVVSGGTGGSGGLGASTPPPSTSSSSGAGAGAAESAGGAAATDAAYDGQIVIHQSQHQGSFTTISKPPPAKPVVVCDECAGLVDAQEYAGELREWAHDPPTWSHRYSLNSPACVITHHH